MTKAVHKATWEEFECAVISAVEKIKDKDKFHTVCAVGRGGMIPAAMIAHKLGITNVDYINYSRKGGEKGCSLQFDTDALPEFFEGILFVDDVAETGGTVKYIRELMNALCHASFVVVYEDASATTKADYVGVYFNTTYQKDKADYCGELYAIQEMEMPWECLG